MLRLAMRGLLTGSTARFAHATPGRALRYESRATTGNQLAKNPTGQIRRRLSTVPQEQQAEQHAQEHLAHTYAAYEEAPRSTGNKLAIAALGVVSLGLGYFTFVELNPWKLAPNGVFNNSFEVVRNHSEVVSRLGQPIKGYGADHNGSREGRRNFIVNDVYYDDDGVKHLRVKYNLEGPNGHAVVYADQNEKHNATEFEYIIVEHAQRGHRDVIALLDNRRELSREEVQDKVTAKFAKAKMELFGHSNCQWTRRQIEELGDFSDRVRVVMCDRPENKEECTSAQLKGYPTWRIGTQNIPGGFKPIEELQQLARQL